MANYHVPVLVKEVIEGLRVRAGGGYVDATVGGGGHGEAILKLQGRLLDIDQDPEAIKAARERFASACPAFWRLARGNFRDLKKIVQMNNFKEVVGVLFDLGVSSHQLETAGRGFSFNSSGPLDMRMNPELKVTAADLVNGLNRGELTELFERLGGERLAGKIAAGICQAREKEPFRSADQLTELIAQVRPRKGPFDRNHPATQCFQALRIAVNDELNSLREALPQAWEILVKGGRLVVISFHSGEDRIVKRFLKDSSQWKVVTRKPVKATTTEVIANPRSRSARLRVAEKK